MKKAPRESKVGRAFRELRAEKRVFHRSDDDYMYYLLSVIAVERGLASTIRIAADLSQKNLAAELETWQPTVAKWECGYAKPTIEYGIRYGQKLVELIHAETNRHRRVSWCRQFPHELRNRFLLHAERAL